MTSTARRRNTSGRFAPEPANQQHHRPDGFRGTTLDVVFPLDDADRPAVSPLGGDGTAGQPQRRSLVAGAVSRAVERLVARCAAPARPYRRDERHRT